MPDDDQHRIPVPSHLRRLGKDLTIHDWRAIIRRLRCDPSVKHVALTAVTYGNRDGTKIHPGIERLANVCNIDYRTVKLALKRLRDLGLMHRTVEGSKYGRGGGVSDEHMATVPVEVESLPLLPPDESDPERDAKRAAQKAKDAARKRAKKDAAKRPTAQEQVISDPEQVISDTGTGDLSSRTPGSEITPPVQGPVHRPSHDSHHSDAPRRGRAGAPPKPGMFAEFEAAHRAIMVRDGEVLTEEDEELVSSTIARDFVAMVVGDLDGAESGTAEGMLSKGAHPKAVVNTILKARGESQAQYRDAQTYLLSLSDDVRQQFQDTADSHAAAHFPEAGHRFRMIFAARLAQREQAATHTGGGTA